MKLIVLHFHFRPGGVRSVIETATPALAKELGEISRVIFASGEARDGEWNRAMEAALHPLPVEFFIEPSFGYISEQRFSVHTKPRIEKALARLLGDDSPALVWAHNLSIARNLPLARAVAEACAARAIPLVAHHHDWWFDHRWARWPEMQRCGFRRLRDVASAVFPLRENIRIAAINRADTRLLKTHLRSASAWLPNPVRDTPAPRKSELQKARRWLKEKLCDDGPVWLMPCRILRRKNVAEAILLARWLRPEATLVTTGSASSSDELPYATRLAEAARRVRWRTRFGLLDRAAEAPSLPALLAASECLLLPSLQEGFGLASIEAAAAHRPLIARKLPNIAPDLHRLGLHFPHRYTEVRVSPDTFDWSAERKRQRQLFANWSRALPAAVRRSCEPPLFLRTDEPEAFAFSRLTLTAQLEVLAIDPAKSWKMCAPFNAFLTRWQQRPPERWSAATMTAQTIARLSAKQYARAFRKLLFSKQSVRSGTDTSLALQSDFLRDKLRGDHLYPLLLAPNT